MELHPHLHLYLPSSTASIQLEARLYLPAPFASTSTSTSTSRPTRLDDLPSTIIRHVRALQIETLVMAAHPWSRLGGNMLDPVLSVHLVNAIFPQSTTEEPNTESGRPARSALLTYNVRGAGLSQGSAPWTGVGADPADFAVVERAVQALLRGIRTVHRVGYSWGCPLAALAPYPSDSDSSSSDSDNSNNSRSKGEATPARLESLLLISPPLSFARLITLFASQTFPKAIQQYLKNGVRVTMIYSTGDQFTAVDTFRQFAESRSTENENEVEDLGLGTAEKVEKVEVPGADHFWRGESGYELEQRIAEWIQR